MSGTPIDLQALAFNAILIGELRAQLEAANARIAELEAHQPDTQKLKEVQRG